MRRRTGGLLAGAMMIAAVAPLGAGAGAAAGGTRSAAPARTPITPPTTTFDCTHWRYGPQDEPAPGTLPSEFDRNDYKRTSFRSTDTSLSSSPHNQCGQEGSAVDLAWGVTQGRPDVRVAVLDSGIEWRDPSAMADLATKAYINIGEAIPPCGAGVQPTGVRGDCNHDGVFNITDFGPIPDLNGNGVADPEDLILNPWFNDHKDNDHNGYIDDIAGWDFLYGDNDPLDTVAYGHGTGEARDSNAAANGVGSVGTCPHCMFIPVRVGDSFIADGQRFAAGVLFALDSHATVVQEALGTITNPSAAQQAVNLAYQRNVVVVASMADEASKHPNLPGALAHTMAVNSVTKLQSLLGGSTTGYLALNGCTNYGGHTFVSVESGACSSEATGISSGVVGLIESEARNTGQSLSANEVMQVVRASADDVDFATPNAVDPANDFGTSSGGLLDTVRYHSTPGWDATYGYGRLNAYEAVKLVRAHRIPPTADIESPDWFSVQPTGGFLQVRGAVAAPHASRYDYQVQWAPGVQPPDYPGVDHWHVAAAASGLRSPVSGLVASIPLQSIANTLPGRGAGAPVDANGKPDEERLSVRLRIVVRAHGGASDGLVGVDQRQIFVHHDGDLVRGYPRRVAGAGTASPVFATLAGHRVLVLATDDGAVHAYEANGAELPGFPVHTAPGAFWPSASPAAHSAGITPPGSAIGVGAPAIADLDHDGTPEIVVTTFDGSVYAWEPNGTLHAGFPVHIDPAYSRDTPGPHDQYNRTKPAIVSSAALGDLDGDGKLEVVVAAADRHVYAWHADGSPVDGFPVLVVDPTTVQSVDPVTHAVTFASGSGAAEGGELIATPALGDLDGDGHPDIVVGAQEEYAETPNIGDGQDVLQLLTAAGTSGGNTRLYAISSKGTLAHEPNPNPAQPDGGAFLPGWPAKLGMLSLDSLPTIGDGVATQAAIGDVVPTHPGPEVVAASATGPLYVLDAHGHSVFGQANGHDLPLAWTEGVNGSLRSRFGAQSNTTDLVASVVLFGGPALGRIDGDAAPDPTAPVAGLTRLIDIEASDEQLPNDDQLTAWSGLSGNAFSGLPRVTSDMAFFVTPAVADLNHDGHAETIAGDGLYMLNAFAADGSSPAGWPKLTGGWLVGTPGLGQWDLQGRADVAVVRRDGVLEVWHTGATSLAGGWPRFGADSRNDGHFAG